MLFAIIATDKPGMLATRLKTRPEHLTYLETLGGGLVFAGPFLDGNQEPDGSLVVIEADNIAEAEAFAAQDPYTLAGLFERVQIRAWKWAINNKEGR